MMIATAPLKVEEETALSVTLQHIQSHAKFSKSAYSPICVALASSVADLIRCSAADRRTSIAFDKAKGDVDALDNDFRLQKVQGCEMSALSHAANMLKPIHLKLKACKATMSPTFSKRRTEEMSAIDSKLTNMTTMLCKAQILQLWQYMDTPSFVPQSNCW